MTEPPMLLAVPNVSEGRDRKTLEAIERGFAPARFLDLHRDPDHGRAVFTLAAPQGQLAEGLLGGARAATKGSISQPTPASTPTLAPST